MNLSQFRAIQKAIVEKVKTMGMGMFGGSGKSTGRGVLENRTELSPNQFEEHVANVKRATGKNVLSLQEVF